MVLDMRTKFDRHFSTLQSSSSQQVNKVEPKSSGNAQMISEALIFFGFLAIAEGFGAIQYVVPLTCTVLIIICGTISTLLGLIRIIRAKLFSHRR